MAPRLSLRGKGEKRGRGRHINSHGSCLPQIIGVIQSNAGSTRTSRNSAMSRQDVKAAFLFVGTLAGFVLAVYLVTLALLAL
jgi:hypothetical protein